MSARVVLITGAGGFIGRYIVAEARARGFLVRAVVRHVDGALAEWREDAGISVVVCDLSKGGPDLNGVDCVIHAAASLTGDDTTHLRDTLAATETVLTSIVGAKVAPHLVLVGSIAVYDTMSLRVGAVLDEATEIEPEPEQRDAYCQAKLEQEKAIRAAATEHGFPISILRLGAVFGPDRLWNGHIGIGVGPLVLRFGSRGQVPTCSVEHAARALVRAIDMRPDNGLDIVNVVDDDLPNRARYVRVVRGSGWPKAVIVLPWRMLDFLALLLSCLPRNLLQNLPGLLRRRVLHARIKPLKYNNTKLREYYDIESLDWFEAAMLRAIDRDVFKADKT